MQQAKNRHSRYTRIIAGATGLLGIVALLVAALVTIGGSSEESNASNAPKPSPTPSGVSATLGDLRISGASARESLNSVAAVYFTVTNNGAADDALLSADAPSVGKYADLHTTVTNGATTQMRTVPSIAVPAQSTVKFETGGNHVMVNGLGPNALKAGDTLTITLTFEHAGKVTLKLPVLSYAEAP